MENVTTDSYVMINGTEYLLGDVIALGGQSVLYRASVKSGKKEANTFVIKVPNNPEQSDFMKEEKLSAAASAASVQFVYTVFQSDSKTRASLIAKLPQSVKTLREFRDALLESVAQEDDAFPDLPRIEAAVSVIASLTEAIECLHEKAHVFHCDLSPENVIVHRTDTNTVAYVIDFGSACWSDDNIVPLGKPATPGYAAPEIMYGGEITPKSDIFSICALLLFLCGHDFMCFEGDLPELTTFGSDDLIAGSIMLLQLPQLVKRQLLDIFLSGIWERSFDSCGQLLEALKSLQDSIKYRGHDIESIRIKSVQMCKKTWHDRLKHFVPELVRPAATEDGVVSDNKICAENTMIIAPSGSGKSVKLVCLWRAILAHPELYENRVPIFIPLSHYNGENDFIRNTIFCNYFDYDHEKSGAEIQTGELLNVLKGKTILLIDGINEVSSDRRGLLSELDLYGENDIRLVLSTRSEQTEYFFRDFHRVTLLPLEENYVREKIGAEIPKRLFDALRLPFFLIRYLNLDESGRGRIESAGELMLAERERKIAQFEGTKDPKRIRLVKLVLCHIFPAFAFFVGQISFRNGLATEKLREACENLKKDDDFEDREFVEDLLNDTYLRETIIDGVLIPTGIVFKHKNGYSFVHQQLLEFYAADYLKHQMLTAKTAPDCLSRWDFNIDQARFLGEIFQDDKKTQKTNAHFELAKWMQTHLNSKGQPLVVRKLIETMKLLSKNFDGTTFAGLDLTQTDFYGCSLKDCDFSNAVIAEKTFITTEVDAPLSDIDVSANGRVQIRKYGLFTSVVEDNIPILHKQTGFLRCSAMKIFPDGRACLMYDEKFNVVIRQFMSQEEIVLSFTWPYPSFFSPSSLVGIDPNHCLAVSADCKTVAATQLSKRWIQIWHLEDGQWMPHGLIKDMHFNNRAIALSSDGSRLIVVTEETFYVYDLAMEQGEPLCEPTWCINYIPPLLNERGHCRTTSTAFGSNQLLISFAVPETGNDSVYTMQILDSSKGKYNLYGFVVFDFADLSTKFFPNTFANDDVLTCAAILSPETVVFGSNQGHLLVIDISNGTAVCQKHLFGRNLPSVKKVTCAQTQKGTVIYGYWNHYITPFSYELEAKQLHSPDEPALLCSSCAIDDVHFAVANDVGKLSVWEEQHDFSLRLIAYRYIWLAPGLLLSWDGQLLVEQSIGHYSKLSLPLLKPSCVPMSGSDCPYGQLEKVSFCKDNCELAIRHLTRFQPKLCYISPEGVHYCVSWKSRVEAAELGELFPNQLHILRDDGHRSIISFASTLIDVLLLSQKGLLACITEHSVSIVDIASGTAVARQPHGVSECFLWGDLAASPDGRYVIWSTPDKVILWEPELAKISAFSAKKHGLPLLATRGIPPVVTASNVYFSSKGNGLVAFSLKDQSMVSEYAFSDPEIYNCRFECTKLSGDSRFLSPRGLNEFGVSGVAVELFSEHAASTRVLSCEYLLSFEEENGLLSATLPSPLTKLSAHQKLFLIAPDIENTQIIMEEDVTALTPKEFRYVSEVFISNGRLSLPTDVINGRIFRLRILRDEAWVLIPAKDDILECESNI